jgi:hypothetical protein
MSERRLVLTDLVGDRGAYLFQDLTNAHRCPWGGDGVVCEHGTWIRRCPWCGGVLMVHGGAECSHGLNALAQISEVAIVNGKRAEWLAPGTEPMLVPDELRGCRRWATTSRILTRSREWAA